MLLMAPRGPEPGEEDHESTTQRQEDVREVPHHPSPRARAGHLHQPPTQAAAGL